MDFGTPATPYRWISVLRVVFWAVGMTLAIAMAHTSRYYVNSDAITYVEMAELFRNGVWSGLVNLTFSPAYPAVLAVAQALLETNPSNEVVWLKTVGVFWFVLAMLAADMMISEVREELHRPSVPGERTLPPAMFTALSYAMFLVASLALIRVQLMNPDMAICAMVSLCVTIVLWIGRAPDAWLPYILLGVATGLGYLLKSFFFLFTAALMAVSFLVVESPKRAVSRLAASLLVYALIAAPLIFALSVKKGGFTYGEGGRHIYAVEVAGEGEPIHKPEVLTEIPKVVLFDAKLPSTRPYSMDVAYWTVGVRPAYRLADHAVVILDNVKKLFSQSSWLIVVLIWFVAMASMGSVRIRPFRPLSAALVAIVLAAAGVGLFCLIRMEPRYIAPFLFIGFVGMLATLRFSDRSPKIYACVKIATGLLLVLFLVILVQSVVDQARRGMYPSDGKASRRAAYEQQVAVKNFLSNNGLNAGDHVAVLGNPPLYWARLAGLKIVGEILDPAEFITVGTAARDRSLDALRAAGIKVVVTHGDAVEGLAEEGWIPIPGTTWYSARLLSSRQ